MKPILFNTEMTKALLDGRKTVTRRVIKPQPPDGFFPIGMIFDTTGDKKEIGCVEFNSETEMGFLVKPKYFKGDVLYVKETWGLQIRHGGSFFVYKADDENLMNYDVDKNGSYPTSKVKWKKYIHMPKEAAIIFLKVTGVRVERLQDITEEQAEKEGFDSREEFISAILKIYPDCTEESWVWVYEFERILKGED